MLGYDHLLVDDMTGPARRPWRRRIGIGIGALVVIWMVAVVVTVGSASSSAGRAVDAIERVEPLASADLSTFSDAIGGGDESSSQELASSLDVATANFATTQARIDSPVLLPLRYTPVIGRQLGSISSMAEAAESTTSATASALTSLTSLLGKSVSTPEERFTAGNEAQVVLESLEQALGEVDPGPDTALIAPVASARTRFVAQLAQLRSTVSTTLAAVRGTNAFLAGPNRYVVLAANNAEMRAGSGMILQVGDMTIENGRMELGDFSPTPDLYQQTPGATVDPDIDRIWGALRPDQEWRNLNLSPRFGETARMSTEMWTATGGEVSDGALAVDIIGLRQLLEVVGPIEVADERGTVTISADNVANLLLLQQYDTFDDDRDARRERLGLVAAEVFRAFSERSFPASALLEVLQRAGEGRHLLMWSSDPVQQAAWEALNVAGTIPEDAVLVSVLNRGGNKLDQFLEVESTLDVADTNGGDRRISVRLALTNAAPEGLTQYVDGPFPGSGLDAGDYLGIVTLTVPAGAWNAAVVDRELTIAADDGPARVLGTPLRIPRGETAEVRFEFDLPRSWDSVQVLPSARVPAVEWQAGEVEWADGRSVAVDLSTFD